MHPLGVARPVAFAQLLLEYLARSTLWQSVKELHRFWDLETGQDVAAIVDEFLFGRRFAVLQNNQGFGNLAPPIIGHGNDSTLENERMRVYGFLHFDRRDVFTAGDNNVFLAIDNQEIALFVDDCHIAGVQPASPQRQGGLLRQLPISRHDIVGSDYDLTWSQTVVGKGFVIGVK